MIWQMIEDWFRGILTDGILSNLSGLFDSVNTEVGEIATQVGTTPAGWNAGIFNMIRSLSENVIVPIAGVIITFVMCYELIQLVIEKNNLHDLDTWIFFKWIFKTFVAVLLVTNTWNIVMGVFDVTQSVVNQSAGVIISDTSIDVTTVITDIEAKLDAMSVGGLLGLWFQSLFVGLSDIVVLHQNGENTAHYVDSIGFQQVPEFLQEQAQQTPVFDKLSPEQQQALSDTVKDTLQLLVDADKRIYGDVTGKTLEAIAAQGYSYKGGQLEKQQPEATPESLMTGETVRTPRGNFYITDMSREQIEAAGFGFHHASEDGKYLIMGNGTQAYAIAAEQPQRDNPLKHVEDIVEQNDNNFDGIINNTPQTPTVADLEQRAKAGEAISVTDLAKAVKAEKREQPQKKPSILKKLDEYKKQAAQQPKDKQKEQKKDLEV